MQIKALCNRPSYVSMRRSGCHTKTLLVMKLTIFLLLTAILQVSARTSAQTVTYSGKAVPLTTVFSAIKKQTGYLFFYRNEDLAGAGTVTLQLRNAPLREALEQVLAGQPLSFAIQGNTIFITLKPPPPPPVAQPIGGMARPSGIHGRVMDSLGTPLSGASVMIKGTKRGTTTDARGDFEIKGVTDNVTLVISFTSYATKEYKVKDLTNRFYIMMSRSNSPLDDVQVIAYGTNTRRFSVGSVSTVTSEEIEKQPVTNVLLALQGRVPGLTVNLSNGMPGSSVHTQIRGQNNIANLLGTHPTDEPLYIVDGVPLALQNQNLSYTLSSFAGNNTYAAENTGLSPLNVLNPSDIESISVLKDADATSIYGSQGANGVIVITTKKGRPGATSLNIRVNTGPNKIGRDLPMLNTQQYLAMRHQAIRNDSLPKLDPTDQYTYSLFPDLLAYDTTKYTNWSRKFFSGTSNNTDAHVSLSGGSQYTTFITSAGYTKSVYNFPGDFSDQRLSLHSGFHHSSLDRRLNIDFGSDFSYDNNNSSSAPALGQALVLPPNFPDMVDPSGKLVWTYNGVSLGSNQMMAYLRQPFSLQTYALNNSLNITYQVLTGLTFRVGMGYSYLTTKEYSADPLSAQGPAGPFAPPPVASAKFVRSDGQTINVEPQVDYRRTIGRGVLTALVGGTYKKRTTSFNEIDASGFSDDALLNSPSAGTSFFINDGAYLNKYTGVFRRLGYIYDKEFIINLTGRRDGSSNFGPGRQFGNFGSVGLGWIFSELKAFKTGLPFLSYGKISGNYGTNGSEGVAPYMYQPFWQPANQYTYPVFQGTRALQPRNLYNPNYSWASKHAINLALDLGFAHDRELMNITWYRNRTGNQLTSYILPSQAGFTSVMKNFNANVQDAGLELSISTVNIKTKDFRWTTSFNISGNRNKLISFPGLATSAYASYYQVGKSTNITSALRYAGINDTTGVFQFYTGKGVRTYKPNYQTAVQGGDVVVIGDSDPKFFGGLGNTFTYKGWSLSLFFQFSKKFAKNYLAGVYGCFLPGGMSNLPTELTGKFWEKPGDKVALQRLTTGSFYANKNGTLAQRTGSYFSSSDAVYSDDSYIRLKNLSLSYSIPAGYLKKAGMKGATIYVNAQNLLTFTNYKFGDPEMPGALYTIPVQRIIAGGVSLDF